MGLDALPRLHLSLHDVHHAPLGTSRGVHEGRPALLVGLEVLDAGGRWERWAEASPLPAFGRATDSIALAQSELLALDEREVASWLALPPLTALDRVFPAVRDFQSGAARHAVEWVMLEALSHRACTGPAELLVAWLRRAAPALDWPGPRQVLRASEVLDLLDPALDSAAGRLRARQIDTWKLKCGRDAARELEALTRLVGSGPPLRLRLDPGAAWTLGQAVDFVSAARDICERGGVTLEFVEDPTSDPGEWGPLAKLCPLAADELLTAPWSEALGRAAFLILKPMVHGIARCLELAIQGRASGQLLLASHAFDGPLALRAASELGCALQTHDVAAGLGPHRGLDGWRVDDLTGGRLLRGERLGPAGLGRDVLLDGPHLARVLCPAAPPAALREGASLPASPAVPASAPSGDALCISRAGALFPARPFLAGAIDLTFADARERAAAVPPFGPGPAALLAEPTEAAIATLLGALERRVPVLLLHPAAPESSRQRLLARCHEHASQLHRDDAVIVPTSGSTGEPHLVVHTRASLLAALSASAARLGAPTPSTRWLLSLPFAHVGGLSVLLRCLTAGACVVVERLPQAPSAVRDLLERQHVTHLSIVPTQLARWLDAADFSFPRSVECVLVGGAPTPLALRQRAAERGVPAAYTYGLTELGSQVATRPPGASLPSAQLALPPLPGVRVALGDGGRILLGGPMLMRRYLGEDAPLESGLLRTGDAGSLDAAGHLIIDGRSDDIIISGGENVAPTEVESALLSLAEVSAVCVVGRESAEWGQEVVAVVVLHAQARDVAAIEQALLLAARAQLPAYARPKAIVFTSELPLLPSGKVDRRRVAAELGALAR